MKEALIYSLKIWLTSIVVTPIAFVLLVALMGILPNYQIPELIGFIVITYVMPSALLVSVWVSICIFCALLIPYNSKLSKPVARLGSGYPLKICLSILSLFMSFACLEMLNLFHVSIIYDYNSFLAASYSIFLATSYSITTITLIWFYKLKPINNELSTQIS